MNTVRGTFTSEFPAILAFILMTTQCWRLGTLQQALKHSLLVATDCERTFVEKAFSSLISDDQDRRCWKEISSRGCCRVLYARKNNAPAMRSLLPIKQFHLRVSSFPLKCFFRLIFFTSKKRKSGLAHFQWNPAKILVNFSSVKNWREIYNVQFRLAAMASSVETAPTRTRRSFAAKLVIRVLHFFRCKSLVFREISSSKS